MEFLDFGKHTPYVLSSFSLTLVVLVANVLAARGKLSSRLTTLRRRIASEEKTRSPGIKDSSASASS